MSQRIWDTLLKAEWLARYYGTMSHRKRRCSLLASALIIGGSIIGGTILLTPNTATWIGIVSFFAVAFISIYVIVFDIAKDAYVALVNAAQLREAAVELLQLWHRNKEGHDVTQDMERLERRIDTITRDELSIDDKLSKECYKDAYDYVKSYLGQEPRTKNATAAAT